MSEVKENLQFGVDSQNKALREQTEIAITLRGQAEEEAKGKLIG